MTTVTAQALYKSCGKCHGKERVKRKAFEATPKKRHRRCGCDVVVVVIAQQLFSYRRRGDMLGQTVPN